MLIFCLSLLLIVHLAHASYDVHVAGAMAASSSCPPGFEPVMNGCAKFDYADPMVKCKKGTLDEGRCVDKAHVKAEFVCPDGFVLKGSKKCESVETLPPSAGCPSGYEMVADECVKTATHKPFLECPKGLKLHDGVCEDKIHHDTEYECLSGYELEGHKCVFIERVASSMQCSKGYMLEGGECVKVGHAKVVHSCPKGYKLDENGECGRLSTTFVNLICPDGSDMVDKKCTNVLSSPATPYCPKGEMIDNICLEVKETKTILECPAGYKQKSDMCYFVEKIEPSQMCEEGEFIHGKCVLRETVPAEMGCPKDSMAVDGECVQRHMKPAKSECPKGFIQKNNECVKFDTVKADLVCPDGTQMKGGKCAGVDVVPLISECKSGEMVDGHCVELQSHKVKKHCPKGYTPGDLDSNTCVKRYIQDANVLCPAGMDMQHGKCARVNILAPFIECPKHYNLDATGQCIKSETITPIMICDPGYELFMDKCKPQDTKDKEPKEKAVRMKKGHGYEEYATDL